MMPFSLKTTMRWSLSGTLTYSPFVSTTSCLLPAKSVIPSLPILRSLRSSDDRDFFQLSYELPPKYTLNCVHAFSNLAFPSLPCHDFFSSLSRRFEAPSSAERRFANISCPLDHYRLYTEKARSGSVEARTYCRDVQSKTSGSGTAHQADCYCCR